MKCADAKTWLSFVTATVNSLRAAIGCPFPPLPPAALEQEDIDRRTREVSGGAGVSRVALVSQLAIEGGDCRLSRGCAHAPCVDHATRPALHSNRFLGAQLARDVRVGPGGEQGEIRLHDRSEEHTSELQSQSNLVCRLLLEK